MKRFSIMVFTCIAWLGLTGASGVVTRVQAEDSFEGHRLFFTEAQRKQTTLKDAETKRGTSSADTAKADSVDLSDTRQRPLSTVRHEDTANDYDVYFTGLVTGMREPQVLVNGLPCEPATAEHSWKSAQPVPVNCHGLHDDDHRLTVSIASGELLVTDRGGRVHRLLPGKGM